MVYAERNAIRSLTGRESLANDQEDIVVTATLTAFDDCVGSLPEYFKAGLMSTGGAVVCGWMKNLSKDYAAEPWDFYLLSNGGFYMAPQRESRMNVAVSGHFYDYESEVSPDAAGIIATLFAFDSLDEIFPASCVNDLYQWLLEYVNSHPESSEIYRVIFRV